MSQMPSDKEVRELQQQYPGLRVWGATSSGLVDESVLGDFPVVPFDDVVAALRACEARVRMETQLGCRGFAEQAWIKGVAAAHRKVENCRTGFRMSIGASPEPPERYWIPKDDALAAIDALRPEATS